MKDGRTRKLPAGARREGFEEFRKRWRVALVVVRGRSAGSEIEIDRPRVSVGRGPGVDCAFSDSAMSREHAVFEFIDAGIRVRDLGSTNGILVNGGSAHAADLKGGDQVQVGEHMLQLVLEKRRPVVRVHVIAEDT